MENLSNLVVHKDRAYGLSTIVGHMTLIIDGVCCDDHEANVTCAGVAAYEERIPGNRQRIRINDRVPIAIAKEIKFTY